MTKKMLPWVIGLLIILLLVIYLRFNPSTQDWLWDLNKSKGWIFPIVTVAALVDSINLCALSVLLLTIAFMFNIGQMRLSVLKFGSSFIAGIFVVYVLIGLGILKTLQLFSIPNFMAKVGAGILIALGVLHLLEIIIPSFPIKFRLPHTTHKWMGKMVSKGTVPAIFALGAIVGFFEFPCVGGPYLLVLGLLHDQRTWLEGLGYLLYYNILFVLPLVLILLIASNKSWLEKLQQWQKEEKSRMRWITGVVMIILGLLIFVLS